MSPAPAAGATRAGRPKSDEKRAAILEAAGRLFLEQGLRQTSMDQVARAAEVSKQTVYSHFKGKEDLFRHCIQAKVECYGFDGVTVPPGNDARAVLRQVAERFMGLIVDPEVVATYRLVIAESGAHPRIAALFFDSGPAATQRTVAAALAELDRRGVLEVRDKDRAAWQFMNLCMGDLQQRLLLNLMEDVPAAELDAQLAGAVEAFMRLHAARSRPEAVSSTPISSTP